MELKTDSEYNKIKCELDEIIVTSSVLPIDKDGNFSIIELIKEYQHSDFFKKYNSFKFNHFLNKYDANDAMAEYIAKLNLVATKKINTMGNTTDNFVWNDKLVLEFNFEVMAGTISSIPDFLELKRKQQPVESRIEIGKMDCYENEKIFSKMKWNLQFKTNKYIPHSEAPNLCKLLEEYLNNESSIKGNKIELLKEGIECVHLYLDDKKAPRKDSYGKEYSIVGRIKFLEKYCSNPMVIKSDNICQTTNKPCNDECCPVGAICNISGNDITSNCYPENKNAVESSKIEITELKAYHINRSIINERQYCEYRFSTDKIIPEDKYEGVKKAISDYLNGNIIYSDWYVKSLLAQIEVLNKKADVSDINVGDIPTLERQDRYKELLKENNLSFSKQTLDAMMENVWNNARGYITTGLDTINPVAAFKFNNFKEYLQSLPENGTNTISNASLTCTNIRKMWNKESGIHTETVHCMRKGCEEYNPLNKEHKTKS